MGAVYCLGYGVVRALADAYAIRAVVSVGTDQTVRGCDDAGLTNTRTVQTSCQLQVISSRTCRYTTFSGIVPSQGRAIQMTCVVAPNGSRRIAFQTITDRSTIDASSTA